MALPWVIWGEPWTKPGEAKGNLKFGHSTDFMQCPQDFDMAYLFDPFKNVPLNVTLGMKMVPGLRDFYSE